MADRGILFDFLRHKLGRALTQAEVDEFDGMLDAYDGAAIPPLHMPDAVFTNALAEILRHEGGFANHPSDPGGMTMLGVTRRAWMAAPGR